MTTVPTWQTWSPDQLATELAAHDVRYHQQAQPTISDAEYDAMRDHLRALAPDHPYLQRVGAAAASADGKVVHARPMLSLDKCTEVNGFLSWLESNWFTLTGEPRIATAYDRDDLREEKVRLRVHQKSRFQYWTDTDPAAEVVMTPKLDGLACSLRYGADGSLAVAATRGDGLVGEDVLKNALQIPGLPAKIDAGGHEVEVRGEVYVPLSLFEPLAGEFANPRNLAAGLLKAKEHGEVGADALRFMAYDLLGETFEFETDKLQRVSALGFSAAPWVRVQSTAARAAFEDALVARQKWDFEADGVVFRHNSVAVQERLPVTAHHPRSAVAWKFPVDAGTSVLVDIEWSVSRSSVITPVAIVEPVMLSGAMVSRATLHNLDRFDALAPKLGDRLIMVRRGGVIPHVEANEGGGTSAVHVPTGCPACGSPTARQRQVREWWVQSSDGEKLLRRKVGAELLVCTTPETCTVTRIGRVLHFASSLAIEGIGEKIATDLVESGLVTELGDLFRLGKEGLVSLPSVGNAVADKILLQLQKARTCELREFLAAIGIKGIGTQTAAQIAKRWSFDQLLEYAAADVANHLERVESKRRLRRGDPPMLMKEIQGIGEDTGFEVAQALVARAAELRDLASLMQFVSTSTSALEGPLAGQVIVFTGELVRSRRSAAQKQAVTLGAVAGDSVTDATTLLVVGGDELDSPTPSSKLKKARKLVAGGHPIQILSEDEYYQRFPEAAP